MTVVERPPTASRETGSGLVSAAGCAGRGCLALFGLPILLLGLASIPFTLAGQGGDIPAELGLVALGGVPFVLAVALEIWVRRRSNHRALQMSETAGRVKYAETLGAFVFGATLLVFGLLGIPSLIKHHDLGTIGFVLAALIPGALIAGGAARSSIHSPYYIRLRELRLARRRATNQERIQRVAAQFLNPGETAEAGLFGISIPSAGERFGRALLLAPLAFFGGEAALGASHYYLRPDRVLVVTPSRLLLLRQGRVMSKYELLREEPREALLSLTSAKRFFQPRIELDMVAGGPMSMNLGRLDVPLVSDLRAILRLPDRAEPATSL